MSSHWLPESPSSEHATTDAASTLESWLVLVLYSFLHFLRLRPPSVSITFSQTFAPSLNMTVPVSLYDCYGCHREAVHAGTFQRALVVACGGFFGLHGVLSKSRSESGLLSLLMPQGSTPPCVGLRVRERVLRHWLHGILCSHSALLSCFEPISGCCFSRKCGSRFPILNNASMLPVFITSVFWSAKVWARSGSSGSRTESGTPNGCRNSILVSSHDEDSESHRRVCIFCH